MVRSLFLSLSFVLRDLPNNPKVDFDLFFFS